MILEESIALPVPPERVVTFLESLDERYLDWHPDHISFRWLDGSRHEEFFFEERIGGLLLRMPMHVTRSADGRMAACTPHSWLVRWVFPWMVLMVLPDATGCRFTQRLKLRFGPIRYLLERTFLSALRQHMREESANLERLLA